MQSCIYEGQVRHTRTRPAHHRFQYRVFLMYLDLDELPTLFNRFWLWSARRPALARFRREDHIGASEQPLAESVRDCVEAATGSRPRGPIRLLTNLSYFGYCFNPVSFYYCFDETGETVETIVCEVNNTPWGERDTYVLDCNAATRQRRTWRFSPTKKMHVSPFIAMDIDYNWALSPPDERLSVYMATSTGGDRFFSASMLLERQEIRSGSLASVLARFPFQTVKVIAAIHFEALRLWWKRCPVHTHPDVEDKVTA